VPDARGWLRSEQLGLFVGLWQGWGGDQEAGWVRLYRPDGTLVPTPQEQAEAAKQRAEEERASRGRGAAGDTARRTLWKITGGVSRPLQAPD
jgi:hypothetical protein